MNKPTKPSQEHILNVLAEERFQRELAEANGELIEWDISDLLSESEEVEEEEVEQEAKPSKAAEVAVKDTKEAVYQALVKAEEGGGYVYLDNINLKALGITELQFAGYCSALAKEGRYQPTSDKAFGIVIIK